TVHEVLGLLEAEGREGAHLLDDLDLLLAGGGEDDVELVFLLLRLRRHGGGACRAGSRDRSRGRDAELVFERLDELRQLEDGHATDRIEQFLCVCHSYLPEPC